MFRKKSLSLFVLLLCSCPLYAQTPEPVEVMTLGTFHFNFPNRDVVQIDRGDQIDVLQPKFQSEIDSIVAKLADFKPTIIAVERRHDRQSQLDSRYRKYRIGRYKLGRAEYEQIGFKLARKLKLNKLHAVDERGRHYNSVKEVFKNTSKASAFEHFYFHNPDTSKKYSGSESVYAKEGLLAELIRLNQPRRIKKTLGNYLIGHFKFEFSDHDYFGADFEAGRWFNRNLRIFRNIQRIRPTKEDRILVIFGAGHLNLLNLFFQASPEYALSSPLPYLKQ